MVWVKMRFRPFVAQSFMPGGIGQTGQLDVVAWSAQNFSLVR
jgi:hypothetical protein